MIVAFDYSMSTPCMCVSFKEGWTHSQLYFLTSTKKYASHWFLDGGFINGSMHTESNTQEQRFDQISQFFIHQLDKLDKLNLNDPANTQVFIEDYSMGSKGRVFHIAECAGILKHKLWARKHIIHTVAPTVIKKYATGKGNAKKEDMHKAFVNQTGISLADAMGANSEKIGSPVSDIVDAFFLAQYAYTLKIH